MKDKIVRTLSLLALVLFLLPSSTVLGYSSGSKCSYLPTGGYWTQSVTKIYRNTAYNSVYIYVNSVYPESGKDNYTTCKFKLYQSNAANVAISGTYTLDEGDDYNLVVNNGYLKRMTI